MRIQATDPGFVAENVMTLRTALPLPKYLMTERRAQFYDRVLEEVRAIPGVRSAAYVTGLPMVMQGGIWPVAVGGEELVREADHLVSLRFLTPQFFATLGVPIQRGRDVAPADGRDGAPVAVVSRSFAERHFPSQDPIGRTFAIADSQRTIVGVVGDLRVRGREQTSEPQVYLPYRQVRDSSLIGYTPKEMVVRTAGSLRVATLLPRIRDIVRAADPEQPVSHVRRLSEIVDDETAPRVTQLRLLATFAAVALLIAGLGIHGLLTFMVSRRSQELGVRMALGAQMSGIVALVLREGFVLALIGIALGGLAGFAAARAMGALLFGVPPADPMTLCVAAVLCLLTVLAGSLRPALRASRVDPLTALRAE
jgi:predicted permease